MDSTISLLYLGTLARVPTLRITPRVHGPRGDMLMSGILTSRLYLDNLALKLHNSYQCKILKVQISILVLTKFNVLQKCVLCELMRSSICQFYKEFRIHVDYEAPHNPPPLGVWGGDVYIFLQFYCYLLVVVFACVCVYVFYMIDVFEYRPAYRHALFTRMS